MHWAEQYAKEIIRRNPDKGTYVVESGITPSGVVHAGNFREVLTQDFVYKSLLKEGMDAKYLYIWDDYDRLRKVPKGISGEWEQYIGVPVSDVPDPWGCHDSYSEHFASKLIEENERCGVNADYVRMSDEYKRCEFAEEMRTALENRLKIKGILDSYRKVPLPDGWMPIRVYCEKCGKDTTKAEYLGGYRVRYTCECGHSGEFDFRKKGNAKMVWRVCWAQRWKHYGVDFESSGKDHHAAGGSWDTGTRISREVFNHEPPLGPMYEFIYAKGQKEKMSSSAGNVFTVSDLLKIYEPEIVRFLYTGKINHALEIPFDMGVLNNYSNYDRIERQYFGKEAVADEKGQENMRAIYELSQLGEPKERAQPPFGFCASLSQLTADVDEAISILQRTGHISKALSKEDRERIALRLRLARNWVDEFAPDQVRILLLKKMPDVDLTQAQRGALSMLAGAIGRASSAEALGKEIKAITEKKGVRPKELFEAAYLLLLGKRQGPRLAPFLLSLDEKFVVKRLRMEG